MKPQTLSSENKMNEFTIIKSKLSAFFRKIKTKTRKSQFIEVGFHGDKPLLELINTLVFNVEVFIETGTNVGSTLAYVAQKYNHLRCLSCEPDKSAYEQAVKNSGYFKNVFLFNGLSQEFIEYISKNETNLYSKKSLFWLDAHGYGFEWPLKDELAFITKNFESGYILIDDFKVPGRDQFGYDQYKDQICSFDYVKDSLNPNINYQLFYPIYKDKSSEHHPLRGWGLIVFGNQKFTIPTNLHNYIEEII